MRTYNDKNKIKYKMELYFRRNKKDLLAKPTKSKARLKYEHKCPNCGKEFISNRITAVYCTDKCRVYAFKKKKKKAMSEASIKKIKRTKNHRSV